MTNRARPTWPDGADSGKSERPSGGAGQSQSTPPATPASNGRSTGNGQPRPGTSNGPLPGDSRPQPRPSSGSQPAGSQPAGSQPGGSQSGGSAGGSQAGKPARPPQQPPVRPVAKQVPPPSSGPAAGSPAAGSPSGRTPAPGSAAARSTGSPAPVTPRPAPSTPGRPEPRLPGSTPGAGQPPASAYGQTGKVTPSSTPSESFGDRLSAAKKAVLNKAGSLKEAATGGDSKARTTADAKTGLGREAKSTGYGTDARATGLDARSTGYDTKPATGYDSKTGFGTEIKPGYGTTDGKVATSTAPTPKASGKPQTRKARLRLSRLDPWSVMKTAFLLSIAFGIVTWVAVFIVWSAIGAAGVFDNINNTVTEVLGTPAAEPFRIENYINTGKVMGFTTLLACADVLIITALATLGSFLYNIAATLLGGLEVTLASED